MVESEVIKTTPTSGDCDQHIALGFTFPQRITPDGSVHVKYQLGSATPSTLVPI